MTETSTAGTPRQKADILSKTAMAGVPWQSNPEQALATLHARVEGLTSKEVEERTAIYGKNIIFTKKVNFFSIFFRQFSDNPLIIILAIATFVSYLLGQTVSSYYIFGIIIASVVLGVWNEFSAEKTIERLLSKISPTTLVERDGTKLEIPVADVTVGDIVLVSTGSIIPADLRFIETKNLEMNESALTGEAKTAFKTSDALSKEPEGAGQMDNIGFMGTSVENGSGKGVVFKIGKQTEFGKIAEVASYVRPTTDFQKGLERFGSLIVKVIIIMSIVIFVVNALLGHALIDSLLFSLAIAVGLTPELLPVIVTVSLSHGAGKLAKKHIVSKQLISIENLGNMDILCTDKTGTLTEGDVKVMQYLSADGREDKDILLMGLYCNSAIVHHKVLGNGIDVALWEYALKNKMHVPDVEKLDEELFDFNKKAMYTVVEASAKSGGKLFVNETASVSIPKVGHDEALLIVKGAPDNILAMCRDIHDKAGLHQTFANVNGDGLRAIAIATKVIKKKESYSWDDAKDLGFEGYVTFLDTPKKSAKGAINKLHRLNVATKIITGDNEIITEKICREIGLPIRKILIGSQIEALDDAGLQAEVNEVDVFARVTPTQKLRIIEALQKNGHTVGYMGDGINDLPSLHNADVGISVNTAVDVAKDAASVVLLRKSLDVIAEGVIEGRKTFNNTIKYILMATSSNFGNMFSAAGASFFLPFLPMTPVQILLTNGIYDLSQLSIPSDNVDAESLVKPRHWNINFIKNYMIFFGPLSSIFDFITFSVMLYIFHAEASLFQTGWFIESVATEILVVFVIRTARTPFFTSKPGKWLLTTCLTLTVVGVALPFITPLARDLGFTAPPAGYFGIFLLLIAAYLTLVELVKNIFLKRYSL